MKEKESKEEGYRVMVVVF